jgi:hypothetical protein
VIAGAVADALGYGGAIGVVAALTAASGAWVAVDMPRRADPGRTAPATRSRAARGATVGP